MTERVGKPPDYLMTIAELVEAGDMSKITALLESLQPVEIARCMSRLDKTRQTRLIKSLGPQKSAAIVSKILDFGSTDIVDRLPSNQAAPIVKEMARDLQAGLLRKIRENDAEAILREIKPRRAQKIRKLMSYPENTAGALILRGIRTDPALASGPLLTTITDMCGFFFVLSFAWSLLPKLSG